MLAIPIIEKTKIWVIGEMMMRQIYGRRDWILEELPLIRSDPPPQEEAVLPVLESPVLKREPRVSTFWIRKLGKDTFESHQHSLVHNYNVGLRNEIELTPQDSPPVEIVLPNPDVMAAGWEPVILSLKDDCPHREILNELNVAISVRGEWVEHDPMNPKHLKKLKDHVLRVGVHELGGKLGRPLLRANAFFSGISIKGGVVSTGTTGNFCLDMEHYISESLVKHKMIEDRVALISLLAEICHIS